MGLAKEIDLRNEFFIYLSTWPKHYFWQGIGTMKKGASNEKVLNGIVPNSKKQKGQLTMKDEQQPVIDATQKKEVETASKIDLIKNLIFGENIQAYESEFEKVKQDILSKKKALEDLIEAVRTDLRMTIDDVSTDINIRITELEDKLDNRLEDLETKQVEKKQLGDLLVELGEKIRKK